MARLKLEALQQVAVGVIESSINVHLRAEQSEPRLSNLGHGRVERKPIEGVELVSDILDVDVDVDGL